MMMEDTRTQTVTVKEKHSSRTSVFSKTATSRTISQDWFAGCHYTSPGQLSNLTVRYPTPLFRGLFQCLSYDKLPHSVVTSLWIYCVSGDITPNTMISQQENMALKWKYISRDFIQYWMYSSTIKNKTSYIVVVENLKASQRGHQGFSRGKEQFSSEQEKSRQYTFPCAQTLRISFIGQPSKAG